MAIVNLSKAAEIDLNRLCDYLSEYSDQETVIAFINHIENGLILLEECPLTSGYSILGHGYHELLVKANKRRQYRLLYEYERVNDAVTVLAIKDAREKSFSGF